jgi:hypothetical protein
MKAFEEGLRSLGYRVGETVAIEYRFANGDMERLPALAVAQAGFPSDLRGRYCRRSRRTASLVGFFDLSHVFDGPLR